MQIMDKKNRAIRNRINGQNEFEGTYEQCMEYFKQHDNGHLELTVC